MFTAEDILCQTNAKLKVINLRVVNLPGYLPAELPYISFKMVGLTDKCFLRKKVQNTKL